ncbi:hypothetical protein AVEN_191260-1 [Araneus ventricosus]|uniref:Uncharacterized protein n=1 Tax=Araneus ventricosus TaxID=182803 RepID=A0A4Y2GAP8_ARAVE|nr:hypothetical protein AVEN_191260-1 [Araneus ventricosus]
MCKHTGLYKLTNVTQSSVVAIKIGDAPLGFNSVKESSLSPLTKSTQINTPANQNGLLFDSHHHLAIDAHKLFVFLALSLSEGGGDGWII